MAEHKIGDAVFVFDINHRVYAERKPGARFSGGGPIYRKHFRPYVIVGEEGRSWLYAENTDARYTMKIGKLKARDVLLTVQHVEDRCWENSYRHRVLDAVAKCDVDALRAVAKLVGWKPPHD